MPRTVISSNLWNLSLGNNVALKRRSSPTSVLAPDEDTPSPVETLAGSRFSGQDYTDRARSRQAYRIQNRNSFSRGFESGLGGLGVAWHGAGALASALFGDDEGTQDSIQKAQEYADLSERVAPEVSDIDRVDSLGTAGSYAAGMIGQAVPSLATTAMGAAAGFVTGGGAGGLAGAGMGGALTTAAGRKLGMSLLKKYIAKQAKKQGVDGGNAAFGAQVVSKLGTTAGAIGASAGVQQGQLAADLLDPEFQSDMSPRELATLAFVGGGVQAVPEALPILNFFGRYGLGGQAKKALESSIAREGLTQAAQEGATETTQQLIGRAALAFADENREILGDEGWNELRNAFAGGSLAGGALGGGARTVTKGAQKLGERLAERAQPEPEVAPEIPTTEGVEVAEVTPEDAGIEEIEIGGLDEPQVADMATERDTLMQEMDEGLPGFTEEDINAEIFGEYAESGLPGIDVPAGGGLEGLRDAQTKVERGTAEDLPRTKLAEEVARPEGSYAPAIEGDERATYEFDKVSRDSRGEPIREVPFEESTKTGWERLGKRIEKLNAEAGTDQYQAIGQDELVKRRAQKEYPGDRRRQAEYIKEQAAAVSASRKKASSRIQPGEDPLTYLKKFKAIEGPPNVDQGGASVGGKVPGDLKLTEEDLGTAVGEIRGEDGFPVTDGRSLGKERTRRQILRPVNKSTLNQGLNESSDVVLTPAGKGEKGKVLNAVSLTSKMRDRLPGGEGTSLAAKAGQWFTSGIGSLNDAGHAVDIETIPGDTVILKQGKKAITWDQARKAMGATPDTKTPTNVQALEDAGVALGEVKGELTEQQAASLNQQLTDARSAVVVAAGETTAGARKRINAEVVAARRAKGNADPRARTEKLTDPDKLEVEQEDKPMRPLKRDTPATGKKVAIGVKPKTILNEGGFKKITQAENAAKGAISKPLGKLRANAVAKQLSEATGETFTAEQFANKTGKEVLADIAGIKKRFSSTGQRVVQQTKTGYAREITLEGELDTIRKSTDDMKPDAVINDANKNLAALDKARTALVDVKTQPGDGRLVPNAALEQKLRDAGLQFKTEEVFFDPKKGRKVVGPKAVVSALSARIKQKTRAHSLIKAEAQATKRDPNAVPKAQAKVRTAGAPQDKLASNISKPIPGRTEREILDAYDRRMGQIDRAEAAISKEKGAAEGRRVANALRKKLNEQLRKQYTKFFQERQEKTEAELERIGARSEPKGARKRLRQEVRKAVRRLQGRVRGEIVSDMATDSTPEQQAQAQKIIIEKATELYEMMYESNKKQIDKYNALIESMSQKMGISFANIHMMTPQEFAKYAAKDPKWAGQVLSGSAKGRRVIPPGGVDHAIFVNFPVMPNKEAEFGVFAHEFGHSVEVMLLNDPDHFQHRKAIKKAYDQWFLEVNGVSKAQLDRMTEEQRAKFLERGRGAVAYQDIINARIPLSAVHIMGQDSRQLSEVDPEHRKYFLSFEEWFADQTARYMTAQPEPGDLVGAFFKKVADVYKQLFKFAKDNGFTATKEVTTFYNEVLGVEVTNPVQTFTDNITASIRAVQPALTTEQVNQIARLARAMFRKENKAQHSEEQIAAQAVQITMAAGMDGAELNYAAMRAAYNNLLNAQEREALHRVFSTHAMKNKVRRLLLEDGYTHGARAVMSDPDAAIAYGYQFWEQGRLQIGPKSQTMFQRLMNRMAKILGVVTDGKNAENVFAAMRDNNILVRQELGNTELSFATPRQLTNSRVQRATAGVRKMGEFISPMFESLFQSAYSRMQGTKNGWLVQLARELYVPPGSEGQTQGMLEAKNVETARWHNRIARVLQGRDEAFKAQVVKGMNDGKFSRNAEVRQVQEELKGIMEDMRQYLVEAGVQLGDQSSAESGYWPWVFDAEKLMTNPQAFKEALARNMPDSFVENYVTRVRGKATYKEKRPRSFQATDTKETVADKVFASIMQSKGYADGGSISDYDGLSHTPYMGSHDTRILAWMAKEPEMSRFLSSDLDQTLISYVDQSIRRAEFARRFGDDGNGRVDPQTGQRIKGIKELLERAEEAGMTEKQRKLAQNFIAAIMGTLGGDLNPKIRQGMSYVMVYENLRLLSMSLFSSLVDPNGILVRSGSFQDTWIATKAAIAEIAAWSKRRKGEPGGMSDIRRLAEQVGTIEDAIGKEALGYEYGGAYMAGAARNVNEKWFEVTGIAGYTRLTRVMATAAAQNFLKRHAAGADKHSARYLDELGLTARDVRLDSEGNLRLLTEEERQSATAARIAADDRLRNAVFRFVDEAILRPDSAQRPVYGSDPHFMLVFHLKGFMYSFYERIMKRAWREAVDNGNLTPAMSLSLYVPGMIFADMLRDAVKDAFGDQDDDRRDDWDLGDWSSHALERSGLYGPYVQQVADSHEDYERFGKLPGMSLLGPAAEHAHDIVTMRGGLDNQLARALPAQNLVRPLTESAFGE